ncbi:hypothetical protein LX64_01848 [Chitinophaga skermanii]|uniref:Uncharacterized protein n=1 Tax=Chitinophaga skermanii TaxID=331697 RepID=A0A327QR49_9BACT|nr:hypothetical protein LX64_01848 [Chitinophaga skermanii]
MNNTVIKFTKAYVYQTGTANYVATMETSDAATETQLFSNVDETRAAKPASYPVQDKRCRC